jgi:hypothetical protein
LNSQNSDQKAYPAECVNKALTHQPRKCRSATARAIVLQEYSCRSVSKEKRNTLIIFLCSYD